MRWYSVELSTRTLVIVVAGSVFAGMFVALPPTDAEFKTTRAEARLSEASAPNPPAPAAARTGTCEAVAYGTKVEVDLATGVVTVKRSTTARQSTQAEPGISSTCPG